MAALGQHIQLRHQLGADDRQHLLHLVAVLCGEPLTHSLDDGVQVGVADAVVIYVFLGGAQVVLGAVCVCFSFLAFPQSALAAAVMFIGMVLLGRRGKALVAAVDGWLRK